MLRYFLVQGGAGERLAPDATVESVRHFLRLFRANYEALVKYQPRRSESSGLFFHATEHDSFNPDGLEHASASRIQAFLATDASETSQGTKA